MFGSTKMARGGPRRQPVPDVDPYHLQEVLTKHVRCEGVDSCFSFGPHLKMASPEAVNGSALVSCKDFMKVMLGLETNLFFKFSQLRDAFSMVLKNYPGIAQRWPEEKRSTLANDLASTVLTLAAHTRRLKDSIKFKEAMSKCSQLKACTLQELRSWVLQDPKKRWVAKQWRRMRAQEMMLFASSLFCIMAG